MGAIISSLFGASVMLMTTEVLAATVMAELRVRYEMFDDSVQLSRSFNIQRTAKVDAPGCVNAADKLGRSDNRQK